MENEAAHLRTDIERYRKLLNSVADEVAIQTIELMIAEKERRLLAIEGVSRGLGRKAASSRAPSSDSVARAQPKEKPRR